MESLLLLNQVIEVAHAANLPIHALAIPAVADRAAGWAGPLFVSR